MAVRGTIGLVLAACLIALAACGRGEKPSQGEDSPPPATASLPVGCILGQDTPIGGAIDLIDDTGAPVTQADFREGPTLVYFGYTFCPDICPLALQMEKQALEKLGEQGQIVQRVLISLDPARDTPQAMKAYVASDGFPNGLRGLTGKPEQIEAAAKAFRIGWQRDDDPGSAGRYTISHTSFLYLMDEDWRLLALFPSKSTPDQAAQCIKAGLAQAGAPQ